MQELEWARISVGSANTVPTVDPYYLSQPGENIVKMRRLGSTDRWVSEIGMGCMPLSIQGRPDEKAAQAVIHGALEAGITLLDTADAYCLDRNDVGHNERLIAGALRDWGGAQDVLIATKGGIERPDGDWVYNGHPVHLRTACEDSLRALGLDAISLYQLHGPDEAVPFSDSLGALSQLQSEGKVQYVGLSNVNVSQVEEALSVLPIVSVQNLCNPFSREAFHEGVVEICEKHGLAFLPYSPVGGSDGKSQVANEPTLMAIASDHGVSSFEVVLAWLLAQNPLMLPIPGASRLESIESSARASDLTLSKDELVRLEEVFPTQ